MLGAGEVVLQGFRFALGARQDLPQPCGRSRLRAALNLRQAVDEILDLRAERAGIDAHLAQHGGHDAVGLRDQGQQQVFGQHLGVAGAFGELLRAEHGLLRLLGVAVQVDVHDEPSWPSPASAWSAS